MDKEKEIQSLRKHIWWREMQFKAREAYLEHKIRELEKELGHAKNEFGDK